jgi:hypothetical protein
MCIFEGCKKRAYYNYENEKIVKYCSEHRKDGMVNLKSKKCFEKGCKVIPSYNYKNEKEALFCSKHKKKKW